MEDKEAIELLEYYKNSIEDKIKIIEKKNKIIDTIIDYIMTHHQLKTMKKTFCAECTECNGIKKDCIKQYFKKKVNT